MGQVRHVKLTDDAWMRVIAEAARQTAQLGRTVFPAWVLSDLIVAQLPPVEQPTGKRKSPGTRKRTRG